MKKFFLALSLLWVALWASAATQTALRVNLVSGEPVTFLLADYPEVSFSGSKFTVSSNSNVAGTWLEMDDVAHIDFTEVSAIEAADAPGMTVAYSREGVVFGNIPAGTPAAVYSLDGRLVLQDTPQGSFTVSGDALAPGIYVVKVGNTVTKVKF